MDQPYNIYSENCPTRMVLTHIADKWALLVLDLLSVRPLRFNEIRREIEGISHKVLSQVLKKLERDGLILRTAFPTVPVTVEYEMTSLGKTLTQAVAALSHWAEANMDAVAKAQHAYDTRGM